METWRFLVSMTILLVVYGIVVTALGEPPSPLQFALAAVFAVIGLYVSDRIVQRTVEKEE
jgi:membrane protein implicated in regulation of membrane protease activity